MKVAIICTGNMGTGLGRHFAAGRRAEVIQERLPGARVVKAWNHVYAQVISSSPDFRGRAASVLLASGDAQAKEAVARLARDTGYDPWDAGPPLVRLQRREGRGGDDHHRPTSSVPAPTRR